MAKQRSRAPLASQAAAVLEAAEGLDRISAPISAAVRRMVGRGRLQDALSGVALGHPLHPALVGLPIGSWIAAGLADAAGERRAARILTAAGVLTALPTAAAGLADWGDTAGAEQRVGLVHLGTNLVGTTLFGASWWARSRRRHHLGVACSVAGSFVVGAGGWLGGHLAYALGVGVDTNAFAGGPTEWTPVVEQSPGEPLGAGTVDGISVAVVRREQEPVRALANRCSHRGGPLAEGEVQGRCIRCPWHGSAFDLDSGGVMQGPATAGQPVYRVRSGPGGLEVRIDEARALRRNSVRARP